MWNYFTTPIYPSQFETNQTYIWDSNLILQKQKKKSNKVTFIHITKSKKKISICLKGLYNTCMCQHIASDHHPWHAVREYAGFLFVFVNMDISLCRPATSPGGPKGRHDK